VEDTIPAKQRTSSGVRSSHTAAPVAFGASFAFSVPVLFSTLLSVASGATGAFAQTGNPGGEPASGYVAPPKADCSVVGGDEVAQILGFAVAPPDESSRTGGICFFPSTAISEEGSASYAIVDADHLPQRRAFYAALARRCGSPAAGAPREALCKAFVELAQVKDLDDYYAARTDFPNAEPENGLGDAAIAAGDALYVKRGAQVFEVVVRRGDALDIDRSIALAKLLLARTPPILEPEPSPSPRRPRDS
jgi:hypothetical protein